MIKLFKGKEEFACPISGNIVPLEEVNDPVFSQKMMGDGFAIIPTSNIIYAPMSGIITVLYPTKHAIGMKTKSGMDILIHIGIDTVKLNGNGFIPFIEQGQKVTQGDSLMQLNLDLIREQGYDDTVIVIFPDRQIKLCEVSKTVEEHQRIALKF